VRHHLMQMIMATADTAANFHRQVDGPSA